MEKARTLLWWAVLRVLIRWVGLVLWWIDTVMGRYMVLIARVLTGQSTAECRIHIQRIMLSVAIPLGDRAEAVLVDALCNGVE